MNSFLPKTIAGFEVAGNDLRITVVRAVFNRRRLISSCVVEDFVGMGTDERRAELKKVAERHQLRRARAFLSLPESSGMVRYLELPVEVRESLISTVEFNVESLSPWPTEEIYWDMSLKDPGTPGTPMRVTIALIPREGLDPWIDLFSSASLPLTGATLSTLAWAHAATELWSDDRPTVLVGLESEYAEGCLVHDGRMTSLRVDEAGSSSQRAASMIARLASLARVVSLENARTIAHGSKLEDLDEDNPPLPVEGVVGRQRGLFGALTAALSGVGASPFAVNIIPSERRYRGNLAQLVPTFLLVLLLFLVGTALGLRGPYQWSVYASELENAIRGVAPTVLDLTDQETELNALSEKYRALSVHLAGGDSTLEMLWELVRVLPLDTWLSAISLQEGAVTITGFSGSASEIQRLIEESPLFEDAEFASSVTRDDAGRDRFTLRFGVGGES